MTSSPLFSTFAFLGVLLSLIPLPWHLHAWNSGTCYFMLWTSLACFNQFVNSVVWAGNALNTAPWWCEICAFNFPCMRIEFHFIYLVQIAIRIILGASVGIPASSLCIIRRLYFIASTHTVSVSLVEVSRWYEHFITYLLNYAFRDVELY
jgi:pheromone a factor receptor